MAEEIHSEELLEGFPPAIIETLDVNLRPDENYSRRDLFSFVWSRVTNISKKQIAILAHILQGDNPGLIKRIEDAIDTDSKGSPEGATQQLERLLDDAESILRL